MGRVTTSNFEKMAKKSSVTQLGPCTERVDASSGKRIQKRSILSVPYQMLVFFLSPYIKILVILLPSDLSRNLDSTKGSCESTRG